MRHEHSAPPTAEQRFRRKMEIVNRLEDRFASVLPLLMRAMFGAPQDRTDAARMVSSFVDHMLDYTSSSPDLTSRQGVALADFEQAMSAKLTGDFDVRPWPDDCYGHAPREIEADLRLPFLDTLVVEKLSFELGDIRNTMVIGTDLDGGIWGSLKTYLCWFDLADLTELEAALEQALDERICAFKLRAEW